MSDPLRSNPGAASGASNDAERETRIEQLLLSGLDHYFAGQYEQAINIWTRVVFLERGHSRARAYIERARSALAERHRESEELLHRGVAAYNAGDVEQARDLLTRAVEQGGPNDMALVFLERLSRLDAPSPTPHESASTHVADRPVARRTLMARGLTPRVAWAAGALIASGVAVVLFSGSPIVSWLIDFRVEAPVETSRPAAEPLPIVHPSEMMLLRARSLYASGHLADALRTLDRLTILGPMRGEADRLRADIQRELLVVGEAPIPSESSSPK